ARGAAPDPADRDRGHRARPPEARLRPAGTSPDPRHGARPPALRRVRPRRRGCAHRARARCDRGRDRREGPAARHRALASAVKSRRSGRTCVRAAGRSRSARDTRSIERTTFWHRSRAVTDAVAEISDTFTTEEAVSWL